MGKSTTTSQQKYSGLANKDANLSSKHNDTAVAYQLMSLSDFDSQIKNHHDIPAIEDDVITVREQLARFYATYTSTSATLSSEQLEHSRFSLLVNLYESTSPIIESPFDELAEQCAMFLRHYRQIPPGHDLEKEIGRWKKEVQYKPHIVTQLPKQTGKAKLLDDLISLDKLLTRKPEDDMRAQERDVNCLVASILSKKRNSIPDPDSVTDKDKEKLFAQDKETRFKRNVLAREILDTFKKGTYGVVSARDQKQIIEDGWHICDPHERHQYRVFVDVNDKRFLREKVSGEGNDLSLSLCEVTTRNKKAFVNDLTKDSNQLFDDAGMFVIDAQGRMFLFSVDDHEDGLSYASFMNCEPVLFAGRVVSDSNAFELHSSSKEYNTNQRMSRLAVHHLTNQAPIIDENAIVLSAPILQAAHAEIAVQKPIIKTDTEIKTKKQIELARAQPLNIPYYLKAQSNNSSPEVKQVFSKHEGVYWNKRPDEIFFSGATIPTEMLHLSAEEQEEIFERNKVFKTYIANRFNLSSANSVWVATLNDFEDLLEELSYTYKAVELADTDGNPIELPNEGIAEEEKQALKDYYYLRQTASKILNELQQESLEKILHDYRLNNPEGIWLLDENTFIELCENLDGTFNRDTIDWFINRYQVLSNALKPNIDRSRGIDVAWNLYAERKLDSIPTKVISQIYKNIFEDLKKNGKVQKTAKEVRKEFEFMASEKRFSNQGLDAIWYIGDGHQLYKLLSKLLKKKAFLTAEELGSFRLRANLGKGSQKPAKFDCLISDNILPETVPSLFTEEEFNVIQEAHALIQTRAEALTEFYFARRDFINRPDLNLTNMMYGQIYCQPKAHPWEGNRVATYLLIAGIAVVIALAVASVIMFAPQCLALAPAVSYFALKVLTGYALGLLSGALLGVGTSVVVDKALKPKPTEIPEAKKECWQFYQLPENQIKEAEAKENGENIMIPDAELFV